MVHSHTERTWGLDSLSNHLGSSVGAVPMSYHRAERGVCVLSGHTQAPLASAWKQTTPAMGDTETLVHFI